LRDIVLDIIFDIPDLEILYTARFVKLWLFAMIDCPVWCGRAVQWRLRIVLVKDRNIFLGFRGITFWYRQWETVRPWFDVLRGLI